MVWGGSIKWFEVVVAGVVWGGSLGLILTAIMWITRYIKCQIDSAETVPVKCYECTAYEALPSWCC